MILTVAGWPGTFDVEIDYRHGARGDGYFQPDDPDEVRIELVFWEFDGRNCIYVEPKLMDDQLFALLEDAVHARISEDPGAFAPGDDSEFYDLQETRA